MTVFKMIFGAILGVCFFSFGKDALEEAENWITRLAQSYCNGNWRISWNCGIINAV